MSRYVGIDPSTKCGLVILDGNEVILEIEITSKQNDPERMIDITDSLIEHLETTDNICIEGFSFGSKGKGVSVQYGLGWLIRAELARNNYTYTEVSPSGLKKFATGKGNTKKDEMVLPIFKRWGYEGKTDNIRDAFVLAKIAQAKHYQDFNSFADYEITEFQKEVLKKIG